ncbi:MAG: STAS domain-containing protein [Pseudomonadota bacterium]
MAVGIFSIFKGKNKKPDGFDMPPESTRPSGTSETERARQREIARATAAKIDAIESAMAFDIFNTPEPAWGSGPRRPARGSAAPFADGTAAPTLPMLELATTELLADDEIPNAPVQPETAPVVEEIAIMFANDQLHVAQQMLIDSLDEVGQADRSVWWMLFDLYQISGQQDAFENVAIDYASRFETSPPTWAPLAALGAEANSYAGVTPTEAFAGVLDAGCTAQLARLRQLAAANPVIRLEFSRVLDVLPDGCALLLAALTELRKTGRELIVVGAAELAAVVRSTIAIGQRDASEAPWLLLLELLQLMNLEKDFEETAMDYCVTYELSPPSFEAPSNVATAASARAPGAVDRFMLPAVIDAASGPLFDAIEAFAANYQPVVLDCSRLARVDYGAASQFQQRLRKLAEDEKKIELRDINHLVAALFKLLAFTDVARLFPHKY